jgi:hypothetical protein
MRAVSGSHRSLPAGAQLPPQEVNSGWGLARFTRVARGASNRRAPHSSGPTLRFRVPNPETSPVKVPLKCWR